MIYRKMITTYKYSKMHCLGCFYLFSNQSPFQNNTKSATLIDHIHTNNIMENPQHSHAYSCKKTFFALIFFLFLFYINKSFFQN